MKKFLALVLALVMTMSLVTVGANAFTDDSQITNKEAVEVLSAMGVLKGYDDGSYRPQNVLTRGAGAKIVAYLVLGQSAADKLQATYTAFDDVTDSVGLAPYIEWAAANGIVDGYGNGKFGPYNQLTEYAFGKMLLTALGYSSEEEGFTGTGWQQRVYSIAVANGVYDGSEDFRACDRETAARMALGALTAQVVVYGSSNTNGYFWNNQVVRPVQQIAVSKAYETDKALWQFYAGLTYAAQDADVFGRPGHSWTYGDWSKLYKDEILASYIVATKNCDIYEDTGLTKGAELAVYTNGVADGKYTVSDNTATYGAQGRLTEVYANRVVNIDTFHGEISKVVAATTDSRGHVTPAYVGVDVYMNGDNTTTYKTYETEAFELYDDVLVTIANGAIQSMESVTYAVGQLTKIASSAKTTDSVQNVLAVDYKDVTVNHTADLEPGYWGDYDYATGAYTWIPEITVGNYYWFMYDQYGNVIGIYDLYDEYVVLDSLYRNTSNGDAVGYGTIVNFSAEKTSGEISRVNDFGPELFAEVKAHNGELYEQVYTYAERNGEYILENAGFTVAGGGEYVAKTGSDSGYMMLPGGDTLHLNANTQILLQTKGSPDGTFAAFLGYKDLPSFVASYVEYLDADWDGYADYVYAVGALTSTRTVFVYDVYASTQEAVAEYPGYFVATVKVKELVNGELKDTEIKLMYDGDYVNDGDLITIGLYDIVETESYGVFRTIFQYPTYGVTEATGGYYADGKRVEIDGEYENLDDAIIMNYTGSIYSGEVTASEASALTDKSIVVFQRDDSGKIAVLYDLYIEFGVYNNADLTTSLKTEYLGKLFVAARVELAPYQMIDLTSITMENNGSADFQVRYFDASGNELGTVGDADDTNDPDFEEGVEVAYALIARKGNVLVMGDVTFDVVNQPAWSDAKLTVGSGYPFDHDSQTFGVSETGATGKWTGTITVNIGSTGEGDVSAADLLQALEQAKGTIFQSISPIYNTEVGHEFTGNLTETNDGDLFVIVTAGDGSEAWYKFDVIGEIG